jgi:hypothetical protein
LFKFFLMPNNINNISIADYYFELLRNLSSDSKLDLISKLSQSLKKSKKEKNISLEDLYGSYKSNETAEEIIAELRASRTFNRKIENL